MTTEIVITVAVAALTALLVCVIAFRMYVKTSREAPLAYLYTRKGKRLLKFDLCQDVCRIGRHPDNEIQINHASVSRFHAQVINNRNGTFQIRDLDSKNGVRIFHRHVSSAVLQDNDVVYVGNVPVKFLRYPADYKTVPDTVMLEDEGHRRFDKRQRHIERFSVNKAIRIYTEEFGWVIARVRDLSEEGMFVQTSRKFQLRLPVDIVMQDDRTGRWLKLTAEVVRQEKSGIALVFTDVDRETKNVIHDIGKTSAVTQQTENAGAG